MKNIFLSIMMMVSTTYLYGLEINEKIPSASSIKMKGVDGKELSIQDVKGKKGTLVVFTCNHCPYVKAWFDRTVAIGNEYSAKGIGVIAVNANDPAASPEDDMEGMKKVAKDKLKYPYVVDETSQVAKAFGATKTPEFYLFNDKDVLVYQGSIDSNSRNADLAKPFLKTALNELLEGKKISNPKTASMGCGIKFRPAKI